MVIMRFSVKCGQCGHHSRPDPSPRHGILKVLKGEFDTCRKCGTKFTKIQVPNRPLVQKLMAELSNLSSAVEIVEYARNVPRAYGLA